MACHFNNATIWGALAPPLPRIMELVEIIHQLRKWLQLPPLPLRYTRPLGPARGTNYQPAPTPALAPALAPAPAPAPAAATSAHVQNVAPNHVLMARFAQSTRRLKDLTPRDTVTPRGDNGTEVLCLSHILRGECNSSCSRYLTHRALTQSEEVSRVAEFLTQSPVSSDGQGGQRYVHRIGRHPNPPLWHTYPVVRHRRRL
jgi:hypothetical protein